MSDVALAPNRRMLNAKQVAERLGCSWRTVYRLADMGDVPMGVKIGGLRRWDAEELDRWIDGGSKPVKTHK
ncbi:MAG: helix-turn-helix transcriptional regulator [Gemmataceae bacterium]